jgi:hypothetical protein
MTKQTRSGPHPESSCWLARGRTGPAPFRTLTVCSLAAIVGMVVAALARWHPSYGPWVACVAVVLQVLLIVVINFTYDTRGPRGRLAAMTAALVGLPVLPIAVMTGVLLEAV